MELSSEDVIIFTQLVDSILAENDLNTISASRIRKELQQKVDTDLTPVKAAVNELIHARFNKKFDEDQALTNGHTATGTSTGSPDNVPKPTSNQVNGNNVSHSKSPAPSRKRPADDDSQEASELDPTPETTTPKKKVKVNGHENDDAAFAARLQAEENRRGRSTRGATVVKKPQSAKKKAVVKKKKKSSTKIKDGSDQDSGSEVTERRVNRNNPFHKPLLLSTPLSALLDNETQLSRPQTVKRIWAYVRENGLQDQSDKRMINCDERLRAVFKTDRIHMFTMNKVLGTHLYPVEE